MEEVAAAEPAERAPEAITKIRPAATQPPPAQPSAVPAVQAAAKAAPPKPAGTGAATATATTAAAATLTAAKKPTAEGPAAEGAALAVRAAEPLEEFEVPPVTEELLALKRLEEAEAEARRMAETGEYLPIW